VQVVLTIALIAALAAWLLAVYSRLARLRTEVKMAWQRLEQEQVNEAVKAVYNKHVSAYNLALETFPGNLIAPAAGMKPARHY